MKTAPGEDGSAAPVQIVRRGYAWSVAMVEWTDVQRAWLAERDMKPRRLSSGEVAAFLNANRELWDAGAIEIAPFDRPAVVCGALPFYEALDWFLGLADDTGGVIRT